MDNLTPSQRGIELGLDLRIAAEKPEDSYIVEAFMDQRKLLVDAEPDEGVPLVLTHSSREWSGNLKPTQSERKLLRWTLIQQWEQDFVRDSGLNVWHQFSPIDKVRPTAECASLVTVLPPVNAVPKSMSSPGNHLYVVPSESDLEFLASRLSKGHERVRKVLPSVRPFIFTAPAVRNNEGTDEGWLLFIVGRKQDLPKAQKWIQILSSRFPRSERKLINLETDSQLLQGENWLGTLARARFTFYLNRQPFDWAVPALESIYCRVPTIFLDETHAISETLEKSPLSLPRFLVEPPDGQQAQNLADDAFASLMEAGVFEPNRLAKDLMKLQRELAVESGAVEN